MGLVIFQARSNYGHPVDAKPYCAIFHSSRDNDTFDKGINDLLRFMLYNLDCKCMFLDYMYTYFCRYIDFLLLVLHFSLDLYKSFECEPISAVKKLEHLSMFLKKASLAEYNMYRNNLAVALLDTFILYRKYPRPVQSRKCDGSGKCPQI